MKSRDYSTLQVFKDKCPECGSRKLIRDYDTGETICKDCGLVINDVLIDKGPEWRAFTQEEKVSRSRVGMPASYFIHDKGLSTSIGRVDRDASGRKLPLSTRLKMWRLRKWQIRSRVHSSIERNLSQAMTELDRLSDKISIPNPVKEKAAIIYRKALNEGLVRGRSIATMAASSLYAACRISRMPRNLQEVADVSLVSKKDIARCYRLTLRELGLRMPIADPLIYLPKIAEKSDVSGRILTLAIDILEQARERHVLAGRAPIGLAAAALYVACIQAGEKKTQKEMADVSGVTEVTVRNHYKILKRQLNLQLPD